MASKTGGQQQPSRRTEEGEETPAPDAAPDAAKAAHAAARKDALDEDIDNVLDEIDGVLEANAEEFVRGFIQKGGQ